MTILTNKDGIVREGDTVLDNLDNGYQRVLRIAYIEKRILGLDYVRTEKISKKTQMDGFR